MPLSPPFDNSAWIRSDGYIFDDNNGVWTTGPVTPFVNPLSIPISGASYTLSNPQALLLPYHVVSGTLSANFTINYPLPGHYQVDASQVTFNRHAILINNGVATAAITAPAIYSVSLPTTGVVAVTYPYNNTPLIINSLGGTVTVTEAQATQQYLYVTTGASNMTSALTIVLPTVGMYLVDCSTVNFNGHTVYFSSNGNLTAGITAKSMHFISCPIFGSINQG